MDIIHLLYFVHDSSLKSYFNWRNSYPTRSLTSFNSMFIHLELRTPWPDVTKATNSTAANRNPFIWSKYEQSDYILRRLCDESWIYTLLEGARRRCAWIASRILIKSYRGTTKHNCCQYTARLFIAVHKRWTIFLSDCYTKCIVMVNSEQLYCWSKSCTTAIYYSFGSSRQKIR